MKNIAFLFLAFLFFFGCTKPPEYPDEPVIEYIRMSANQTSQKSLREGESLQITATLSFTDGDGDIGNDDGETTIFITDLRDDTPENSATRLPKVPEPGANNGISGEITFRLLPTCCIWPTNLQNPPDPCNASDDFPIDTLIYEVFIVDRAGNQSNKVQLEPILISCD